jgi:hypothetical protein
MRIIRAFLGQQMFAFGVVLFVLGSLLETVAWAQQQPGTGALTVCADQCFETGTAPDGTPLGCGVINYNCSNYNSYCRGYGAANCSSCVCTGSLFVGFCSCGQ